MLRENIPKERYKKIDTVDQLGLVEVLNSDEQQHVLKRLELYNKLCTSLDTNGLDKESVNRTRSGFSFNPTPEPIPYDLTSGKKVEFICAPLSQSIALRIRQYGERIASAFWKQDIAACYLNTQETAHITIFHTSKPEEPRLEDTLKFDDLVSSLEKIAHRTKPFWLEFYRVCIASSGAIIMLLLGSPFNLIDEHLTYDPSRIIALDHLRNELRRTFTCAPRSQTTAIFHVTIGRIISENVSIEDLKLAQSICEEINNEMKTLDNRFVVDKLWLIEESHEFSATGKVTTVHFEGKE